MTQRLLWDAAAVVSWTCVVLAWPVLVVIGLIVEALDRRHEVRR